MDFFSPDYFTARDRFRTAVLAAGGQIESILLNAKGPASEDLTIDLGWFGCTTPRLAFVHISGLHGVEGFAGSAIQLQWLNEGLPDLGDDEAIVIIHVMNPYGMAWLRRVNENNVDLNRNFLAADEQYSGAPELYTKLNAFLNPESPATFDLFRLRAAWYRLRYGSAFTQAITAGQYDFPRGLFYGGTKHEQTTRRFQVYIHARLVAADRLAIIDVHTGDPTPEGSQRGGLDGLFHRMFPATEVSFAVQEFATESPMSVVAALRGPAKLLEVFCPSDPKWRENVLARGQEVITQGLAQAFSRR